MPVTGHELGVQRYISYRPHLKETAVRSGQRGIELDQGLHDIVSGIIMLANVSCSAYFLVGTVLNTLNIHLI